MLEFRPLLFLGAGSGYNLGMFLALLSILIVVLMGTGNAPDQAGWIALVGMGWLAGYLDCRMFSKSDQDADRVMPPDIHEPYNDQITFEP